MNGKLVGLLALALINSFILWSIKIETVKANSSERKTDISRLIFFCDFVIIAL